MEGEKDSRNFPIKDSAEESGSSQRPAQHSDIAADVPKINLAGLHQGPLERSLVVDDIRRACKQMGFFQIVNHGICQSVLDDAISASSEFFDLPTQDKKELISNDVYKPVRYDTGNQDCRVFLKHYAHPLEEWIHLWPSNPPDYRDKMGRFSSEIRRVGIEVMGAITESLGLSSTYLADEMEDGVQVMAINCYQPCPQPKSTLGLPPHTDHSCITLLLQSSFGLQIKPSKDGPWINVPEVEGALQVQIGDHFEVLSNGAYKSIVHSATLDSKKTRISIGSFHNLGMDTKMETAKELVDELHPKGYKESSFSDFLDFLSTNDVAKGKTFMDSLKI